MRFFRPSWSTLLAPLLFALFAFPLFLVLPLLYALLAWPLWPVIRGLGLFYRDKPSILTFEAIELTVCAWAMVFCLLLCVIRHWRSHRRQRMTAPVA